MALEACLKGPRAPTVPFGKPPEDLSQFHRILPGEGVSAPGVGSREGQEHMPCSGLRNTFSVDDEPRNGEGLAARRSAKCSPWIVLLDARGDPRVWTRVERLCDTPGSYRRAVAEPGFASGLLVGTESSK